MKIKILAFGIAKEIIGASNIEIQVENNCTILKLKENLEKQFPKLKGLKSFSFAINQDYADNNSIINAHDEVVLLPPVSGG